MNNNDLAESLAAAHGLTKANARQLVDDVFSTIVAAAAKGEEVSLTGFGKFKVKATPAREGRNPATGAKELYGEYLANAQVSLGSIYRTGQDQDRAAWQLRPRCAAGSGSRQQRRAAEAVAP